MLKLSYSTAFTVSMLSWAFYEFKGGYESSNNAEFGANTIRWGADYLMKVSVTNYTSTTGTTVAPIFVAQVGASYEQFNGWLARFARALRHGCCSQ